MLWSMYTQRIAFIWILSQVISWVDENDNPILIDFGASKHYDGERGENTSTLIGVNTRGYAPIEQMTQSFTNFSPVTDIYALGATFISCSPI